MGKIVGKLQVLMVLDNRSFMLRDVVSNCVKELRAAVISYVS